MADSQASQPSNESKVHIVYTEKPEDQEPEEYHIKTLTSVLGRFELFFQFYPLLFSVLNYSIEIWGCGSVWIDPVSNQFHQRFDLVSS